jgi:RNA polymerase sigma factor (sigma-70 family)
MFPHAAPLLDHLRRLTSPPQADADLLVRWVRQRDEEAFAALVARHGPMVLGVCQRVLGHPQDAEDAFQATFLILARKAASLRRPEALAGWLHGVAVRLARKARTATARRRKAGSRPLTLEPADRQPDPLDLLTVREWLALFDEEIYALAEVYRLPLVLCDLEGRTQEEAARLLGWTIGSLRGRLLRGRTRLKRQLIRRGLALPAALVPPLVPATSSSALPAIRITDVTRAAVLFSSHSPRTGISGAAVELARAGLRGMMLPRLTMAAAVVLTASVLVAGASLAVRSPLSPPTPAQPVSNNTRSKTTERVNKLDLHGDPLPEGAIARLGTVRLRHGLNVSSVAFSPDRKTLASGGQDNTVRIWEIATGKEIHHFTAIMGPGGAYAWVQSIAYSPDGKFLAAGIGNGVGGVVIWELATGKEARRFSEIQRAVTSVVFSSDGKVLAAADVTGLIRLWDASSGAALRQLKGHKEWVESITFSPDGKTLASASRDKTIRLWDPNSGRELRQFQGHTDMVLAVAFTPDSKTLASGSWDHTIRLWDVGAGNERRVLQGHFSPVSTVVFQADGKTLASGSWDHGIRLWNTATGKELRQMQGHRGPVTSIALSLDGKTLASGSWDHTVRLWDPDKGKELRPTEGSQHGLWSVALSPDGKQVATGGEDGVVRLWESGTGKAIRRLLRFDNPETPLGIVDRLDFSPDGKTVTAATWGYTRYRWEAATSKLLGERRYKGIGLVVTPEGKYVASGDAEGTIFLQDAATAKILREFKGQKQQVSLAISSDGKYLASGSSEEDGTVVLWELATGKERCRCKGAPHRAYALTFSPDGKYLAGTTSNTRVIYTPESLIYLWDTATGQQIRQFRGQEHFVACLVFSTDGRTLASGAGDKTVRLWEVATGKERQRFEGHQSGIRAIAFSRDGVWLASASQDTTAIIWDVTGGATNAKLPAESLQALWTDLASNDGAKAYRAIWHLARTPAQSVPLLREHLPPAAALDPAQRKQVEHWLTDLDSDEPSVRDRASRELEKRGLAVESMLRKVLEGRPTLEQRKRIERLLEHLERERVTLGRVLELLERAAAPESRQLLEALAGGDEGAWLTREAKASLERVARRTP